MAVYESIMLIEESYATLPVQRQPRVVRERSADTQPLDGYPGLRVTREGSGNRIAVLAIDGVLSSGLSWDHQTVYMDDLQHVMHALKDDPTVLGVIIKANSPGGDVNGMADLVRAARDLAAAKPLFAFASGMCTSGMYWLSMAARDIGASRTATIGSIGARSMLIDTSRMLDRMGVTIHPIATGKEKTIGTPGVAVTEADKQALSTRAAEAFAPFLEDVCQRLGQSADAITALQARVMYGQPALAAGLVNRVMDFRDYAMWCDGQLEVLSNQHKESSMSNPAPNSAPNSSSSTAPAPAPAPTPTGPIAASVAELERIYGNDHAAIVQAAKSGMTAEQAREDCITRLRAANQQLQTAAPAPNAAPNSASAPAQTPAAAPTQTTAPAASAPQGVPPLPGVPRPNLASAPTASQSPFMQAVAKYAKEQNLTMDKALVQYASTHKSEYDSFRASFPRNRAKSMEMVG